MSLTNKLKNSGVASLLTQRNGPVWGGPCGAGPDGGVTQSLLGKFLVCRERFRLYVIEGLRLADTFNHKLEFGNAWHVCEEALARDGGLPGRGEWEARLKEYALSLCRRYPLQQEQVDHWYNVVKVTFPLYVQYWSKHPDVVARTPLLQEHVFDVPYELPSGRTVRLRGKWDSVDLVGKGKEAGIFLKENKSKGDIREDQIKRQLSMDLQTMMYLVALGMYAEVEGKRGDYLFNEPIKGVVYNVVRRPLSGGKGTIVRHKPSKSNPQGEAKEEFYHRVADYIKDEPQTYFMRWSVLVTPGDVQRFRRECLDPILEQLCDWYQVVTGGQVNPYSSDYQNYRTPFGIYNPLLNSGSTDMDAYLDSGSTTGLTTVNTLFPELE